MKKSEKIYDLVLFETEGQGASLVTEYVCKHMSENLRWAIVGTQIEQLESLIEGMKESYPDRKAPAIELFPKDAEKVMALVTKANVVISLLGPDKCRELVLEACARNGVHCITPSFQTPWLAEMIKQYHDIAKESGAIIIVGLGAETAPQDLLAFTSVTELRKKLKLSTREVICARPDPSHARHAGSEEHKGKHDPWILCPSRGRSISNGTNCFGVRKELTLGHLSASKRHCAQALVHRSWVLLDGGNGEVYGQRFCFNEFLETRSSTDMMRKLFGKCCGTPRGRLSPENGTVGISMRAVAIADQEGPYPDRALSELTYSGTSEQLTAAFLVQGASTLFHEKHLREKLGGGILTPAMLGMSFVERLQEAGIEIESMLT
ncbi:uncharacterized protein PAC_02279 [Phialocephala subalpina]|uniref:Saccharopine dehydrogenase NADP binding domain-containing protein n=1 Tax=Phialocephala subalpina TaxID=576137 RepID=A0A1L7WI18_9HELO|nr:uncharacterized protein PAC_02279 [Phialocephala subalpina]